jgi:hypothetical protein
MAFRDEFLPETNPAVAVYTGRVESFVFFDVVPTDFV